MVALIAYAGERFDGETAVVHAIAQLAEKRLALRGVLALELLPIVDEIKVDTAFVLAGVAAMDRSQAQRQWPVLAHCVSPQVPAVQPGLEAFGAQVAGGFGAHDTRAPGRGHGPIGPQHQASGTLLQAGAAVLPAQAGAAAQALEPETPGGIAVPLAHHRQQAGVQRGQAVLGGAAQVGVLAAGQLFKHRAEPVGRQVAEVVVVMGNPLQIVIAQNAWLPQCVYGVVQYLGDAAAVVGGGVVGEIKSAGRYGMCLLAVAGWLHIPACGNH